MTSDAESQRTVDLAARLVLLRLDKVGPARLRWLTSAVSAIDALTALRAGRLPDGCEQLPPGLRRDDVSHWFEQARQMDAEAEVEAHAEAGVAVLHPDDDAWPFALDPDPPALLFARGRLELLGQKPAVGMVGTRRCTSVGRNVADRMTRHLVAGGVTVVSGLALGIDGAAHRACLDAGGDAVAVVAGGLDVIYPPRHAELWREMGERGLVLSEWPLGSEPATWKFPARNRLIAALSDLVVVVESHAHGGALSTAEEAADRGVTVAAVPGSPVAPSSAGTNALIFDGCPMVRHAADVLELMGLDVPEAVQIATRPPERTRRRARRSSKRAPQPRSGEAVPPGHPPTPAVEAGAVDRLRLTDHALAQRVVDEVLAGEVHIDRLVVSLAAELGPVLTAIHELGAQHIVRYSAGMVGLSPEDTVRSEDTVCSEDAVRSERTVREDHDGLATQSEILWTARDGR